MKKLRRKLRRATVEAYGCMACYGTPSGCAAACGSSAEGLQRGMQAQLDIQYLTIYY